MKRRHPGAFFFLALAIAAACSILPAAAVFAQDTAASAATARGFEGLEYNPAAVAAGRSEAVGFGAVWAGSGGQEYGFKAVFSDSLILDYQRSGSEEELKLLYALAFPRESAFHFGVRAEADLLDFRWPEVDLATGLLWYPHRYLAVAAVQEHLLEPGYRRYIFGLGLRPFTDRLTLFGDLVFPHDFSKPETVVGLRAQPLDGIEVGFRTGGNFRDFIADLSLSTGTLSVGFSAAGELPVDRIRLGAGVRYDFRPSPSVLEAGPRTYRITFEKPIDPHSVQGESIYNLDSLVVRLYGLAEQRRLETVVVSFRSSAVHSIEVLEELTEAFACLKSRGIRIVSYLDSTCSEFDYLAAAAGTTVVASPYSLIPLVGVGARQLYFKRLFEEAGIQVEYARSGDYKTALDPFLRESISEANRRQLEEYLAVSYQLILDILVSGRGLSRERAVELVDGGPYWGEEAVELGLVDEVAYYRDFEEAYLEDRAVPPLSCPEHRIRNWRSPQIAVVKASGAIVSSQSLSPWQRLSSGRFITEKNLIPVLEHLETDGRTAAVVLYIDSGGGDGMVSDKIWRAIMDLKEEKPVVVVMGRLAASGGYYLAMAGQRIFARGTTLTGSIGSYTFKLVIADLLERFGVTTDSIRYGENVELFSPLAALNERQREKLKDLNDRFTAHFYDRVASSRSMPIEAVEQLGGGRIYSGREALELELIDQIGGVYFALCFLEEELGLTAREYRLRFYPDRNMLFLMALEELGEVELQAPRGIAFLARYLLQ